MIAAAIGAATSLASAIGGGIASAVKNRQAERLLAQQQEKNQQWYEMEMAKDYTQRSDAQAIMKKQREMLEEQYNRARATNVVAGGTEEQLVQQQKAANESLADTMTGIASEASAHKDAVGREARYTDRALTQQEMQLKQQQANNIANAASQGVNAGLSLIGADINAPGGNSESPDATPSNTMGDSVNQANKAQAQAGLDKTINKDILGTEIVNPDLTRKGGLNTK